MKNRLIGHTWFTEGEEALKAFQDEVLRINPFLPKYFSKEVLTKDIYELEVKPVPPGKSGLAYYKAASYDKTRKGAFFINTLKPDYFSRFDIAATTLHEGNPGEFLSFENKKQMREPGSVNINISPNG